MTPYHLVSFPCGGFFAVISAPKYSVFAVLLFYIHNAFRKFGFLFVTLKIGEKIETYHASRIKLGKIVPDSSYRSEFIDVVIEKLFGFYYYFGIQVGLRTYMHRSLFPVAA